MTSKFKWCLWSRAQMLFFLPLQPPPPESGNKSRVFALSWTNGWAGGQTSITDENMRLSGGPLKVDCWGGQRHPCPASERVSVFIGEQRGGGGGGRGWDRYCYTTDDGTVSVYQDLNAATLHKYPQEGKQSRNMLFGIIVRDRKTAPTFHLSSFLIASHRSIHVLLLPQHVTTHNDRSTYARVLIYCPKNSVHPHMDSAER